MQSPTVLRAQDSRGVCHKREGGTTLPHMMEVFPRAWHLLECHKVLSGEESVLLTWLNINNKAAKEVYGKIPQSSRADRHTGQSDGVGGVMGDTESE